MKTRMYDPITVRLEQPVPLAPEKIITSPTPEQVANALGGVPDLGQVLRMLGGKITPLSRPAGPDAVWDAVQETVRRALDIVPGQAVFGGKPEGLNPLAGVIPDKSPAPSSLADSLDGLPRPGRGIREATVPPDSPSGGSMAEGVPLPRLAIPEFDGGLRTDLSLEAIIFHGGNNPNEAGREKPTTDEWARVHALLKDELNGQQTPSNLETPQGRVGSHLAARLLQVESAIDNGPGGRAGITRGSGFRPERAGEAVFLLLSERQLKNSLAGLANGNSDFAIEALEREKLGCELVRENPDDPNMKDAGLGGMGGWAGGRAHSLGQLIDDLRKQQL